MPGTGEEKMIVSGTEFAANSSLMYSKIKVNEVGGKSVGVMNKDTMKSLYLSTPLMLTWGVNKNFDEKTGKTTYDMSLQFPRDDYQSDSTNKFLKNMKELENQIKQDALVNCKDWFNKTKMSDEVVDALWTPMLKYPKNKDGNEEFDYTRPPTLRIKINYWDGVFKCELYDMEQKKIFPNETGVMPTELIAKATNVATVVQCGGLWFSNGKFGVTWRLVQAVVKPKQSLMGKCHIVLTGEDKAIMSRADDDDDEDGDADDDVAKISEAVKKTTVNDSDESGDDDDDSVQQVTTPEPTPPPPEPPKKKPVVRRKKAAETD